MNYYTNNLYGYHGNVPYSKDTQKMQIHDSKS